MKYKLFWLTLLSIISLVAEAEWQCFVADKRGHTWYSPGQTKENANAVALSFCTAYSPNSGSCHVKQCVEKNAEKAQLADKT